jgi:RNA polymerase sigma factor (TIGR02999 family)
MGDADRQASEELLPLVYDELRDLAVCRMAQESPGHTLQATALVHEAYVRLIGTEPQLWQNRGHFFAAAAEAMRRILVEHARRRGRIKRGGDRGRVPLSVADLAADTNPSDVVALDEALRRLEEEDERMFQVIRLRFFAGLSIEETAAALGISPRTAKRDWTGARAWLYEELYGDDG